MSDLELHQLRHRLHEAEQALEAAERRLSEAALQRRRLAQRLAEVQEAEQRRISAELHDRIGQDLAALGLNLGLIASPRLDRAAIDARVHDSRQLLERASAVLRNLIAELRPVALDEYGLFAGLRALGEDVERRTGLQIAVQGVEPAPRLPAEVETALFRIAQEALTNVAKHARASAVELSLRAVADGVRLRIADDGCGFDPAVRARGPRRHWGMEVMRDRAESVGARMLVDAAPGHGTRIEVEWEATA
ncbi:sensor histidine kinase [Vulcaniibacterium gelatinicum]|uniref:sensor histidine kinase n=1 Tax=Vulcaniibacterium gelatinicum TaxID=2598725 RepID=UPI0011C7E63E|nr:sensor histidine kinase [Vulcaniibacterium gelatinicum]